MALLALFLLYGLITYNGLPGHKGNSGTGSPGHEDITEKNTADPADVAETMGYAGLSGNTGVMEHIPAEYGGRPYIRLSGEMPSFTEEEKAAAISAISGNDGTIVPGGWMQTQPQDELGRCQPVTAVVGPETIPSEERESIREIEPSGWKQAGYEFIEGGYLYNRCHLVGYQLCGVSADERNLVTGTHYVNVTGMQPWEDWVAEYVCRTSEHVLYRVTPCFEDGNLVASGILMEAEGLENSTFRFCVYCFNVQPGVRIDYRTGYSEEAEGGLSADEAPEEDGTGSDAAYILNTNSGKFHRPDCEAAKEIAWRNRIEWVRSREELAELGYVPCGVCRP